MVDLARTFVSFSSADKGRYDLMCAWKRHEHINFNFADFQLDEAINSKTPLYIKSVCAAKVRRADTFVLLIGNDTRTKTVFVKDEVEVVDREGLQANRGEPELLPVQGRTVPELLCGGRRLVCSVLITDRRRSTQMGEEGQFPLVLLHRRRLHAARISTDWNQGSFAATSEPVLRWQPTTMGEVKLRCRTQ